MVLNPEKPFLCHISRKSFCIEVGSLVYELILLWHFEMAKLNPIKLAYNPMLAGWPNLLIAMLFEGKRGDYQNCSVLFCVLKLCTVISTLRWAVLTVLWIGLCHTGPILLCVDLFVYLVYFVCFCFILHMCCIIVSTVEWTWWDWSLILRTYLPSVLWHSWLGYLTHRNPFSIWPVMRLMGR